MLIKQLNADLNVNTKKLTVILFRDENRIHITSSDYLRFSNKTTGMKRICFYSDDLLRDLPKLGVLNGNVLYYETNTQGTVKLFKLGVKLDFRSSNKQRLSYIKTKEHLINYLNSKGCNEHKELL